MSSGHLPSIDRDFCWHPFTSSEPDPAHPPLVIVRGQGEYLWDSEGRRYIDGNSSIWCNLHGHNHPRLNQALTEQMSRVAHSSFLGLSNEPAALLAQELITLLHGPGPLGFPEGVNREELPTRVFFSDNGSCANEIAAKMAVQYFAITGRPQRRWLVAFDRAYHGDTMLNVSLGGVGTFSRPYEPLMLRRRESGRLARANCTEECAQIVLVRDEAGLEELLSDSGGQVAAVFVESALHGAGGLIPHTPGRVAQIARLTRESGALLVLDEVLAGFGRTGHFLGCYPGQIAPDIITLSKGLTGGYAPLALTLAPERIYRVFEGDYYSGKLLYHGHTYTAHPLACAVARENLRIFQEENTLAQIARLIPLFQSGLESLRHLPGVREVRSMGLIGGVEMEEKSTRGDQARAICHAVRKHGLLTRPIGNTIVLMPPYCVGKESMSDLFQAVTLGIKSVIKDKA